MILLVRVGGRAGGRVVGWVSHLPHVGDTTPQFPTAHPPPHPQVVFLPSSFFVSQIFEGLIWFLLPTALVIANDIAAYLAGGFQPDAPPPPPPARATPLPPTPLAGFFFGRTPLIKLSPKKTWEGFLGGAVGTVIASWYLSYALSQFRWFTCPRTVSWGAAGVVVVRGWRPPPVTHTLITPPPHNPPPHPPLRTCPSGSPWPASRCPPPSAPTPFGWRTPPTSSPPGPPSCCARRGRCCPAARATRWPPSPSPASPCSCTRWRWPCLPRCSRPLAAFSPAALSAASRSRTLGTPSPGTAA